MLNKIRLATLSIQEKYRTATRQQRRLWLVTAIFAAMILYRTPALNKMGLVVWVMANGIFAFVATIWGAFHPRCVIKGWQTATKWAIVGAFATTLGLLSAFDTLVSQNAPIPYSLFLVGVLVLFPFLCGLFALVSLSGAALGAYAYRRRPELIEEATRYGVSVHWLLIAITLPLLFLVHGWLKRHFGEAVSSRFFSPNSLTPLSFLAGGFAVFSLLLIALVLKVQNVPYPLSKRLSRRWSRTLVRKITFRGKTYSVSLRGGLLGGIAALFILSASMAHLLEPLQTGVLTSMMKLADTLPLNRKTGALDASSPNPPAPNQLRFVGGGKVRSTLDASSPNSSAPLVILEMDRSLRRESLYRRDECEIQGRIIRELVKYGAKRIVLPLPTLDIKNLRANENRFEAIQYKEATQRANTAQKVDALCATIRKAGNVIVAIVPDRTQQGTSKSLHKLTANEQKIAEAAKSVVSLTQETFGATRLPCLQIGRREALNAAPRLFAALTDSPDEEQSLPLEDRAIIAGASFPIAVQGRVIVDFGAMDLEKDILHLSYSDIQHGEDLLRQVGDKKEGKKGAEWETTGLACRGKIVFLDALVRDSQETFMGRISSIEVIAHTTEALYSKRVIERFSPVLLFFLTLVLCVVGGHFTYRNNPFDAAWRLAAPLLPIVASSFITLLVKEVWFDPVPLILGLLLTYVFVVQSGYSVERDERERNRALLKRFVSPQVIEKYLDEPELLGLGGVKQQVCVIFVDVRNFTGFAESRDPQEVISAINEYMGGLTVALRAGNGILDKYTGDGLMAFFPINSEGLTATIPHALGTAIEMQREALRISVRRAREGKAILHLGIGVHYGEAVTGLVGSDEQLSYTAMGLTVVVSARLQSLAGGGEVVMSESVHAAAGDAIPGDATIQLGEPIKVKGVTELIAPYRLSFNPVEPSVG